MAHFYKSLSFRLFVVAGLGVVGIVIVLGLGLWSLNANLYGAKHQELRRIEETAESLARSAADLARAGKMSREEAMRKAGEEIGRLRFDKTNYVFVMDLAGVMLVHPSTALIGKSGLETRDADGHYIFREMIDLVKSGREGILPYRWPKPGAAEALPKLSWVAGFDEWGWVIGTGMWVDDVDAEFHAAAFKLGVACAIVTLLLGLVFVVTARSVTRPLSALREAMVGLGHGDLDVRIDTARTDEIGDMAQAVVVFRDQERERRSLQAASEAAASERRARQARIDGLIAEFRRGTTEMLERVGEEMHRMEATAGTLQRAADGTAKRSDAAAHAAREASKNVTSVSAAGEEISAQIGDIQGTTGDAVAAIGEIVRIMEEVDGYTSAIAAAVEEQGAATGEIARNVASAAGGTQLVADNIDAVDASVGETTSAASDVAAVTARVAQTSDDLRRTVDRFLGDVAAA